MTLYERINNTVEAEQWYVTPEGLERIARFVVEHGGSTAVLRGVVADDGDPVLRFYCAQAETLVNLRVGGAVAAERDGSGFYPIAPDVLAEQFEALTARTEASPTAEADGALTDDELADALDRLEWDQEG